MPLTQLAIRSLKPNGKTVKHYDSLGLYLEVSPKGSKWWRIKYRFGGVEKRLALGVYPEISLKLARKRCLEARLKLDEGMDPGEARKIQKMALAGADSFESIAREWHTKQLPTWSAGYGEMILSRFQTHIFPWIGKKPINEIKAPDLLAALRRIENRGTIETAHRTKYSCGQVFRYAIATGRAERDPSADLRGALPPKRTKHHASITEPKAVGELLRAIDAYEGHFVTHTAMRLAPLVFVRPGELRKAQWSEIDFEKKEWHIPPERMKMREKHIVPLSRQALKILRELEPRTNRPFAGKPQLTPYLFPCAQSRLRSMSNNAVLAALRRMGYAKEEMTGHGFRSMASTLLHEMGWEHQLIERQLAHAERNLVSAAYNYAQYLPKRRKMMQAWADYLDTLKQDVRVVSMFRTG